MVLMTRAPLISQCPSIVFSPHTLSQDAQASGSLHIQISMVGSFVLLFFSPEIYTFVPKALETFLRSPL